MKSIQYRPYQQNDSIAIDTAFEEYKKVLYQLPTGGGKSVIIAGFVEKRKDKKILVLAHKRRLLTQMQGHMENIGQATGVMIAQREENLEANIVIASVRTAVKSKRLETLLAHDWDYVIIDEARHSRTGSYDTVLEAIEERHPMCKVFGVDATPYRKDKKRLDKHFEYLVVSEETVASLTEKGFLQSCKAIVTPIDKESLQEQVKEVANDYQQTALSEYMRQPKFIDYVVNQYKEYGEGRQNIVFAVDKAHARAVKVAFEAAGYTGKVEVIDSDMSVDAVEAVYTSFENKTTQILINIEMATEGVDLPSCGCITGARPTKSLTLYLQMGGRGTRPDGEHDYFILLDCCGWTDEFGTLASPKQWSLDPEVDPNNPRTKNKVVGKRKDGTYTEDLTEFIGEVVEMTPEEYITHLSGGMEIAKQANVTIEEKIEKLKGGIISLFSELLKKDWSGLGHSFDLGDKERPNLTLFRADSINENNNHYWVDKVVIKMSLKNTAEWYAELSSQHKRIPYMMLSKVCSVINAHWLDDKELNIFAGKVLGYLKQITTLEKSKINLDTFKEAAAKVKQEEWIKAVHHHAKTNGVFILPTKNYTSNFFKKDAYGNINELHVSQINGYHNKITIQIVKNVRNFAAKEGESRYHDIFEMQERTYVPGEKVMKILEEGNWVPVN